MPVHPGKTYRTIRNSESYEKDTGWGKTSMKSGWYNRRGTLHVPNPLGEVGAVKHKCEGDQNGICSLNPLGEVGAVKRQTVPRATWVTCLNPLGEVGAVKLIKSDLGRETLS